MATKKKMLVGTWYAIRLNAAPNTPARDSFWTGELWGSFLGCFLYHARGAARVEIQRVLSSRKSEIEIVPVRCRPLVSKRANPKRTR